MDLPASLAVEGAAMRRSLVRDFSAVANTSIVMTLDPRFGATEPPGPWETVCVDMGLEIDVLSRLMSTCDASLIIAPETNGILLERARLIENIAGERSLGCTSPAIQLATNKLDLARHWNSLGIRTPETWTLATGEPLPKNLEFPAILKPIDGAGCVDTLVLECPDAIPRFTRGAILQPWIAGIPMSATCLVDAGRLAHLVAVGTQHIECVAGQLQYRGGELPINQTYWDRNVRAAIDAVPGLRGIVGIDFVWTDEGSVVIEINPRPTTSIAAIVAILGPGILATVWLQAMEGRWEGSELADLFARDVSWNFDPAGRLLVR